MAKKNPAAVALGRRGGKARLEKMTREQRSAVAKKAAVARWAKLKSLADEITERSKALEKIAKKQTLKKEGSE